MANFITLEHLRQTAAALLEKIHGKLSKSDISINTFTDSEHDYSIDEYGNYKVGTIEDSEIKIPVDWIHDSSNSYSSLSASSGGNSVSLVTTGEKYNWNQLSIGYIDNGVLHVPNVTTSNSGSSYYSGAFYFIVPSSGTGYSHETANVTIT